MAYATLQQLKDYLKIINSCTFTADASANTLTLAGVKLAADLVTGVAVHVAVASPAPTVLPAPLVAGTVYYVIAVADQVIQLATTSANAAAGTAIDLTTAGAGTRTIYKAVRDDDLLEDLLDRVTKRIETYTGRHFAATTATRYYAVDALDPDGYTLWVDEDLLTVTSLTNGDGDATTIPAAAYLLQPRNTTPKYAIGLLVNGDHAWQWDTDGWVAVAGTWGYSTTAPDDVVQACLDWAAYAYQLKDSQVFDVTAYPDSGVIMIPKGIPAHVKLALTNYVRLV